MLRTWRAVNHGSCGRMSQQLRLSRAWSPAEMPLGLKSSVYGCQRYALNRLFVQQKNTCGALGRSHTFLLNHAHEESHDVMYVTVTSTILMRETLPFAVRRGRAPIFGSINCNGGAAQGLRHGHLAQHPGLPTTLSKTVQSTPTLSQNSNRGRGSPKVQRPDQPHSKTKLQPK